MYKDFDDEKVEDLVFSHYFFIFLFCVLSCVTFICSLLLLYHFKVFSSYHFVGNAVIGFSCSAFIISFILSCNIIRSSFSKFLEKRKKRKSVIDNALKDVEYIKTKLDLLKIRSESSVLVDTFTTILSKRKNKK